MAQKYDKSLILRILKMNRYLFAFTLLLAGLQPLLSQTIILVKSADLFKPGTSNGRKVQRLIGGVHMAQVNTDIYCDSAYLYSDSNSALAFGNVRIFDATDSLYLEGEYLEYQGNTRIAQIRRNVILKDDSTTLYTDNLDYNRNNSTGYYFNGGKLVDSLNVLTSLRGYYNSQTKQAQFIDSVVLNSPDLYMEADTLGYSTLNKEVNTRGRTLGVTPEADSLRTRVGMLYQPRNKYSEVYYGAILTSEYEIVGDTLIANDSLEYYQGMHNVTLESFDDSLKIYANQVYYEKADGTARAYDQAYLRKMMNGDSLFIKADTLVSVQSEKDSVKYLSAYYNGQLYKSDMQARADSITYNLSDSTIYMYRQPVIWNINSQITADSIRITTANNKVDKMYMRQNSFVISQDTTKNFNQVKGRNMVVLFDGGFIRHSDVFGNGESIYFAFDQQNGTISMNKLKCSNMSLRFENNFVTELRTYREVDGNLVPEQEILDPERTLRGFKWRIAEKPTLQSVISNQWSVISY